MRISKRVIRYARFYCILAIFEKNLLGKCVKAVSYYVDADTGLNWVKDD